MKKLTLTRDMLVTGENSLDYLAEIKCKKAVIITGGQSMKKTGVLDKVTAIMEGNSVEVSIYSGVGKNPTTKMVLDGLDYVKQKQPDCILAVGGGSSIDAAKVMLIFYEHPEINFDNIFDVNLDELCFTTKFIAVPSTSGTASEVTKVSVITFEEEQFKRAIRTINIFPNIAILDPSLPVTLPSHIAAETGMDALTHALEAYINKNGNDFTDVLAKGAIEGIIEWLPESVIEGSPAAREKIHNYQCMAGMAFANSGLGMVHGVSHAFGGMYNVAHGLANAVILPYSMDYNKKDPDVFKKYEILSRALGNDVIGKVKELSARIGIPANMQDAGVSEEDFKKDFDKLLGFSMKGSTVVNPIPVSKEDMKKFLDYIYYGKKIDF
ncbi:MAG TPA: iron-containing alcohol dehydrogenase [Lachnospiraceae bacterium]|nr:iron-containing alcohol dehydrogenase [Lachnospiraceae bacterium]